MVDIDYKFVVIIGIIIATIGFAFAFTTSSNTEYTRNLFWGDWNYFLLAFPNLFSGLIIGVGGLAISGAAFFYIQLQEKMK